MLASPGTEAVLAGPDWTHEFKWDGIRVLVVVDRDGGHRLLTRNGNDARVAWPEFDDLAAALPVGTVLDGEVVVLDESLRPDFALIAHRMHVRNEHRVARLRCTLPGQLMLFDVLADADGPCLDEALEVRRDRLRAVVPSGGAWAVTPVVDDLATILAVVDERGLEGVVGKRRGSLYRPGVRSSDWRKLRRVREADAVVVGWRGVDGARTGPVASLALARWDPDGSRWASLGSVGSGLTDREGRRLAELVEDEVDIDIRAELADIVPREFVATSPRVVIRVRYLEATPQGHFRHPVYRGQRADIAPRDVTEPA